MLMAQGLQSAGGCDAPGDLLGPSKATLAVSLTTNNKTSTQPFLCQSPIRPICGFFIRNHEDFFIFRSFGLPGSRPGRSPGFQRGLRRPQFGLHRGDLRGHRFGFACFRKRPELTNHCLRVEVFQRFFQAAQQEGHPAESCGERLPPRAGNRERAAARWPPRSRPDGPAAAQAAPRVPAEAASGPRRPRRARAHAPPRARSLRVAVSARGARPADAVHVPSPPSLCLLFPARNGYLPRAGTYIVVEIG